jgi:OmpA-OmpF porin, OOP family
MMAGLVSGKWGKIREMKPPQRKFYFPFTGRECEGRSFIMYTRFLLLLALLTAPKTVFAENREGAFTISPFVGGQGFPVLFNGEEHFDADFYWGVRGGYNFTQNLRAELLFGQCDTKRDPGDHYLSLYQYGADLDYFFWPDKQLVPFVSAGIGGFSTDFDDNSFIFPERTSTYLNLGGGAEYSLTDWFALRADFRYVTILDQGEHGFAGAVGFRLQFGRGR